MSNKAIPNKTDKYKPIAYTFRIPNCSHSLSKGLVRCPPFHIQLDHALAVIWSLLSKEKVDKPLGIAQLQWALTFLKNIRKEDGECPKDVNICIQLIEDTLIQQYAEMVEDVEPDHQERVCCIRGKSKTIEVDGTESYLSNPVSSKPQFEEHQQEMVTERLPFSVNYAEMYKNSPNCVQRIYNADDVDSLTDTDVHSQYKNFKKFHSPTDKNSEVVLESNCSKADMAEFLKSWRKEQIGKIQQELKRLHSIETFMGNVDQNNFQPYLDEQQITVLTAQKTKKIDKSDSISQNDSVSKKNKKPKK